VSIVKNALNTYNIEEVNLIDKTQATKKHDKVYAQFFFEHVFMEDYEKTLPAEKSYLFVNHEWLYDWDMKAIRNGVIPLCKTILAYNLLASVKFSPKESLQSSQTRLQPSQASLQPSKARLEPIYVGFGNNSPLPDFEYKIRGLAIHFAGASPTKGTFNLIKTWEKYIRKEGILIVSFTNDFNQHKQLLAFWDSLKPQLNAELPGSILEHSTLLDYLNLTFERVGSLYLYKGSFDSLVKNYLQAAAQIHICPSIIEGWGHYIDEARRNKANVLVLDAPPMNELIFAYHVDEKGQKHLTKQCVPIYITGEFKNSISNAWTVYLQKEYPVLTYEPSKKETLAEYIKEAFNIEKYKDAIEANLVRSQEEGLQFTENINKLLAPQYDAEYFASILQARIRRLNAHSTVQVTSYASATPYAPATSIPQPLQLKYCCPSKTNENECSAITTKLQSTTDIYAIMTLIFGGDAYLPGVLLLGSSIRSVIPPEVKNIELCCMVTKDVSPKAREAISKVYDKILEVNYIEIAPELIKHASQTIKAIYAKTFTKLRIFEFFKYSKVLFLDADMLVLKPEIISLFNLETPACIFLGHLSEDLRDRFFKDFTKNGTLFKKFQKKYCNFDGKELHGNRIPYIKGRDDEETSTGMNIETSVLLIKPSEKLVQDRDKYIRGINKPIRGDTEMISRLFKHRIYAIDPRFFGRWVNPYEHGELVVLDLYGTMGKPWDVNKLDELVKNISSGDMTYWWATYIKFYDRLYRTYRNAQLDNLYTHLVDNKVISQAIASVSGPVVGPVSNAVCQPKLLTPPKKYDLIKLPPIETLKQIAMITDGFYLMTLTLADFIQRDVRGRDFSYYGTIPAPLCGGIDMIEEIVGVNDKHLNDLIKDYNMDFIYYSGTKREFQFWGDYKNCTKAMDATHRWINKISKKYMDKVQLTPKARADAVLAVESED